MAEVINPGNTQTEIPLDQLLFEVMKQKKAGHRFDQACAAYVDGKFELSYSFSEDDAYSFDTLRVVVDLDAEIPSVSNIYPCASFYENEMRELFGCRIEMIGLDFKDKLYRLNVETPMLPEAGKKLLREELEAKKNASLKAASEETAAEENVPSADGKTEDSEKTSGGEQ